ncbi:MAG: isopentenyl-diphosphate Delta-isomerase [Rhodocyclaceae bacterium]|nr:isopentenyl-diphosphate Delta-isomerase [Rhodocyclaceae bacterium]
MSERVILVDENDHALGEAGKLEAHRQGVLHRAFSTFVFDARGRLLLQRRAVTKYHSGGLWTNTCCGHPRPGEALMEAANRRLMEEMGIECSLRKAFSFIYRAELDNGLVENEFDHVLIGQCDDYPRLNPDEADAWASVELDWLSRNIRINPDSFTYWLRVCSDQVVRHLAAGSGSRHAIGASQYA